MQKYYDTQGSKYSGAQSAYEQNDSHEAAKSHNGQHFAKKRFKAQSKEILMRSVLNLYDSLLRIFF